MTVDRDTLALILDEHLSSYRAMTYSDLAERLESPRHEDHLDVTDGSTPDGTAFTIETNILWDDHSKGHIRVMSHLSTDTRGWLLGFIPLFSSDVADGFVLCPDGSTIDE